MEYAMYVCFKTADKAALMNELASKFDGDLKIANTDEYVALITPKDKIKLIKEKLSGFNAEIAGSLLVLE